MKYLPLLYDDYVQSANSIFHFMKKCEYLIASLNNKALFPRYCIEDVGYLNICIDKKRIERIAVLQKCFCDIPFHKLMDRCDIRVDFAEDVKVTDEERREIYEMNTHPDLYGQFAIAFSKQWGERNNLQPVQYINEESEYAQRFSMTFSQMAQVNDLPDDYADEEISRLAFMKPLRGIMERMVTLTTGKQVNFRIRKNFHDEQEWRYIPSTEILGKLHLSPVIVNSSIIDNRKLLDGINKNLVNEKYSPIWLKFDFDDIRYILVRDNQTRLEIIQTILRLPDSKFSEAADIDSMKDILISKILVLEEIKKDW